MLLCYHNVCHIIKFHYYRLNEIEDTLNIHRCPRLGFLRFLLPAAIPVFAWRFSLVLLRICYSRSEIKRNYFAGLDSLHEVFLSSLFSTESKLILQNNKIHL